MMKYYVLVCSLQNNDEVLREKYKKAAKAHNEKSLLYFQGSSDNCDSGFDLFVPHQENISPHTYSNKINHQLVCNMLYLEREKHSLTLSTLIPSPEEYVRCGYYLYPRSSTGSKTPLRLSNSVGIIDPSYCGNIISVFDNHSSQPYSIEPYQRLVQLCCPNMTYPMFVVFDDERIQEHMERSRRGSGGFGSTGK